MGALANRETLSTSSLEVGSSTASVVAMLLTKLWRSLDLQALISLLPDHRLSTSAATRTDLISTLTASTFAHPNDVRYLFHLRKGQTSTLTVLGWFDRSWTTRLGRSSNPLLCTPLPPRPPPDPRSFSSLPRPRSIIRATKKFGMRPAGLLVRSESLLKSSCRFLSRRSKPHRWTSGGRLVGLKRPVRCSVQRMERGKRQSGLEGRGAHRLVESNSGRRVPPPSASPQFHSFFLSALNDQGSTPMSSSVVPLDWSPPKWSSVTSQSAQTQDLPAPGSIRQVLLDWCMPAWAI